MDRAVENMSRREKNEVCYYNHTYIHKHKKKGDGVYNAIWWGGDLWGYGAFHQANGSYNLPTSRSRHTTKVESSLSVKSVYIYTYEQQRAESKGGITL